MKLLKLTTIPSIIISLFITFTQVANTNADTQIKVLTYNIWNLPIAVAKNRFIREKVFCEILEAKVNDPNYYDIILIQEVWMKPVAKRLMKCGYPFSAYEDDGSYGAGLLILSRLPILDSKKWVFPKDNSKLNFGEQIANKGLLGAELYHPEIGHFMVFNTHLISNYHIPGEVYENERREQMTIASQVINAVGTQYPVIFGGDWNFSPNSISYEKLWDDLKTMLPNYKMARYPADTCTFCPPNYAVKIDEGKIDHLIASPQFAAQSGNVVFREKYKRNLVTFNLSDHFGWETTFSFRKNAMVQKPSLALTYGRLPFVQ